MKTQKEVLFAFGVVGMLSLSGCLGLMENGSVVDNVKNIIQTGKELYTLSKEELLKKELLLEWAKKNKKLKEGQKSEDFIARISLFLCEKGLERYRKVRNLDSAHEISFKQMENSLLSFYKEKIIKSCFHYMTDFVKENKQKLLAQLGLKEENGVIRSK